MQKELIDKALLRQARDAIVALSDAQLDVAERFKVAAQAGLALTAAIEAAPLAQWSDSRYDERQRAWCLRYENETTFEPLMDGYETGETSFAEAAKLSLFWFESWASDAYLRAGNGNIPGGEMDLFDAQVVQA